ncbi:unnamed protein product [Trifolium pratense]|uniref:Uncharacterized protein n=1 Tax=Trifolium pratense TaxID=57577 RepID=A0ACB0M1S1_TRIPR|nr:unnamed protein product [Trifolium pratense]
MGACDIVASNLTIFYLAIIVCLKIYGVCYNFMFVLTLSTTILAFIFVATLIWDLFQKFSTNPSCCVFVPEQEQEQPRTMSSCKGGICWHGVADHYPASKMRLKIPLRLPHDT